MRLILVPAGASVDPRYITDFIRAAGERGVNLNAIHVAEQGEGRLIAAVLPVISPGRTALILAPGGVSHPTVATALAQLLEAASQYCRKNDVHLVQSLLDPGDHRLQQIFQQAHFLRMAELYYLQGHPPAGIVPPPLPAACRWETYCEKTHSAFAQAIMDSYHGSLDCPALSGLRDIEDVIAGHKVSGTFNPQSWFLLLENQCPLGVLLLNEGMRGDALELVYLGLCPAARGRQFGQVLMRQALATAKTGGFERLCLAVDALNTPALKLYYRHGMQRVASKVAMLRNLRQPKISG